MLSGISSGLTVHVDGCAGGGSVSGWWGGMNGIILVVGNKLPISIIVFTVVAISQGGHSQSVPSASKSPTIDSAPLRASERRVEFARASLLSATKNEVKALSLS